MDEVVFGIWLIKPCGLANMEVFRRGGKKCVNKHLYWSSIYNGKIILRVLKLSVEVVVLGSKRAPSSCTSHEH